MSGLIRWLVAVVLVTGLLECARAESISAAGGANISQDMEPVRRPLTAATAQIPAAADTQK
ncbi:hypothetical protein HaLaN_02930, partial [Haematococcus lacustris]